MAAFGTSSGAAISPIDEFLALSTGWQGPPIHTPSNQLVVYSQVINTSAPTINRSAPQRGVASTPARDLQMFHEDSGLTWDQVARMFGVSRRSVHLWAAGGRMSAQNQETLTRLSLLLPTLPGSTPEARRHELLRGSAGEASIVDKERQKYASTGSDINRLYEPRIEIDAT